MKTKEELEKEEQERDILETMYEDLNEKAKTTRSTRSFKARGGRSRFKSKPDLRMKGYRASKVKIMRIEDLEIKIEVTVNVSVTKVNQELPPGNWVKFEKKR